MKPKSTKPKAVVSTDLPEPQFESSDMPTVEQLATLAAILADKTQRGEFSKPVANAIALWKECYHQLFAQYRQLQKKDETHTVKSSGFSWPGSFPISFDVLLKVLMPKIGSKTDRRPKYREFLRWYLPHRKIFDSPISEEHVIRYTEYQQKNPIDELDYTGLLCDFIEWKRLRASEKAAKGGRAKAAKAAEAEAKSAAAVAAKAQRSERAKK